VKSRRGFPVFIPPLSPSGLIRTTKPSTKNFEILPHRRLLDRFTPAFSISARLARPLSSRRAAFDHPVARSRSPPSGNQTAYLSLVEALGPRFAIHRGRLPVAMMIRVSESLVYDPPACGRRW